MINILILSINSKCLEYKKIQKYMILTKLNFIRDNALNASPAPENITNKQEF